MNRVVVSCGGETRLLSFRLGDFELTAAAAATPSSPRPRRISFYFLSYFFFFFFISPALNTCDWCVFLSRSPVLGQETRRTVTRPSRKTRTGPENTCPSAANRTTCSTVSPNSFVRTTESGRRRRQSVSGRGFATCLIIS